MKFRTIEATDLALAYGAYRRKMFRWLADCFETKDEIKRLTLGNLRGIKKSSEPGNLLFRHNEFPHVPIWNFI